MPEGLLGPLDVWPERAGRKLRGGVFHRKIELSGAPRGAPHITKKGVHMNEANDGTSEVRRTLAGWIMGAIIVREGSTVTYLNATRYARDAVAVADALLAELDVRAGERAPVTEFRLPPEPEA